MSTANTQQKQPGWEPIPEPFTLHPDDRAAIEHEMTHYDNPRAASIGALKTVQARHGWVPDGALSPISNLIGISVADLEGVATFYNMIFRQPVGRHVIKICDSIACHLTGYQELVAHITDQFGIRFGETTGDGRFTLLPVCCLGACDKGPVLMINDDTHFNVDVEKLSQILEQYS
jgi:NADH-quinone oxidoreductase subunit E